MKRHAALADLARDHFQALRCAQIIGKARSQSEMIKAAGTLLELWRDELIYHFREEEEALLPILSRCGPLMENAYALRMLGDHAYLRDGLRRLQARLDNDEDFSGLLRELGIRLQEHARFEDREMFGYLEETLSEEELREVAAISHQLRALWGRPVGPIKASRPSGDKISATHLILFVADQDCSRDFYRFVLGLQPRLDVPGMTEFELTPGTVLGLMPHASARALLQIEPGLLSSEVYLVVPDPQAMAGRAVQQGATVLSPLSIRSWGAEVIYLRDPEGHILALANREV